MRVWDKSQPIQEQEFGISPRTSINEGLGLVLIYNDCLVSVPILPKIRVWDEIQPFHKQGIVISPITSINESLSEVNLSTADAQVIWSCVQTPISL